MAGSLRRRPIAVLFAVALVAGSVLGLAAPASAHNFLVSSDPSAGQTLTKLPSRFTITTNEGLLDISGHGAGFAFDIEDASGKFYGDGCVTVTGSSMSIAPTIGQAGSYRVLWQIVSADGHIVSNTFNFTWKPSTAFTPAAGASHPQDCGGKSGGTAPPDSTLGQDAYSAPSANLGLVLGIGGGILALGIALAIVLLVTGRRKKP
ncbi:MAG: transporter [Glaciihabitans sp.]|jgi:methionine-rich copper-binding protein CopC|nr:transporter [Glaciihabitans sp.]